MSKERNLQLIKKTLFISKKKKTQKKKKIKCKYYIYLQGVQRIVEILIILKSADVNFSS